MNDTQSVPTEYDWDNVPLTACRQMLMTEEARSRRLSQSLSWIQNALRHNLYDIPQIIEEIDVILKKESKTNE